MGSRWDDEDEELDRDRLHGRDREPDREPSLGESIDAAVRKITTSFIIGAGLIALGIYGAGRGGGGDTVPDYQMVTAPDGHVYRLNTDSGSIVACQNNHCWLMQRGSHNLEDEPPAEAQKQNAAAAQPAPQPQAVQAPPAQPQLPAPQNQQAPAAR